MGKCTEEMERKGKNFVGFTRVINCSSITHLLLGVLKLFGPNMSAFSFLKALNLASLLNSGNHAWYELWIFLQIVPSESPKIVLFSSF